MWATILNFLLSLRISCRQNAERQLQRAVPPPPPLPPPPCCKGAKLSHHPEINEALLIKGLSNSSLCNLFCDNSAGSCRESIWGPLEKQQRKAEKWILLSKVKAMVQSFWSRVLWKGDRQYLTCYRQLFEWLRFREIIYLSDYYHFLVYSFDI